MYGAGGEIIEEFFGLRAKLYASGSQTFLHGGTVSRLSKFRGTPVVKITVFPKINNAFCTSDTCSQVHFK